MALESMGNTMGQVTANDFSILAFLTFHFELQNLMQQCAFACFWQGQAGLVKGLR